MNDPLEEKTKGCFLCNRLSLFGSKLKDSFVLDVEVYYWILHGLSYSNSLYWWLQESDETITKTL